MVARKWLFILGLLFVALITGCAAPTDAAKARSRSVIESGGIVSADELRVAEYLAYYKQSFPAPVNTTLGLDLRMGNQQIPVEGGTAWLQIGIQAKTDKNETVAPLNLAIVIDRSGSMDTPEKMPYLKQSLRVFLSSLAANDLVALVAFSTDAEVLVPARQVGDGSWITNAVNRLEPSGSTNLYAGMILGFKEVERNYDVRRNNRVILLTDGIANVGVIDSNQIAADAKRYNERGIYLSTIGLGREFNDALLSQLAGQSKGAYHFVDSAAEMDKVFRQQVSGLIQKAASDVSITLRPASGITLEAITGFEGTMPTGPVQIKMHDMGTGDSQVVLARMRVASGASGRRNLATIELRYRDLFSQRDETMTQTIMADAARMNNYDATFDVEVLRNVTIQKTAEGLKEIDRLYKAQRYQDAWQLANRLEQDLRYVAKLTNEAQMIKDADMMRKYQDTLSKWVEKQTGRAPASSSGVSSDQPIRGREPTPAAAPIQIK